MSGTFTFEFVDAVTSDLTFVARAGSLEAAFAAAAEALLAAGLENPQAVQGGIRRPLSLDEPDLELLLLRFLNELVYLRDAQQLLLRPRQLRITLEGGARLETELEGERICTTRHRMATEVKAATAHALRLERTEGAEGAEGGWELQVTLDV